MKKLIALLVAFVPVSAFAQSLTTISNINDVSDKFTQILNTSVIILISFSVVWIIVNVVRYLIAGGEEDRKKGGMAILWGVVGLFVILSIWGLVAILKNSFKTNSENIPVDQFPKTLVPPPVR